MSVRLITITPKAEELIAYCARVSSPNQENPEIAKLLKYCVEHKHWSIFEQASMTVEITTSRMISAQILRHRSFVFQEFSQRYAEAQEIVLCEARRQDTKNRQNSIDDLSDEIKEEWVYRQEFIFSLASDVYQWALDNGIAKECARAVLPMQTKTKLYMTGSIRSWIHYLELRTGPDTQKEHRDIAGAIKFLFVTELPVIAEGLGWA
jgi:thymidylate synthase (FAD)